MNKRLIKAILLLSLIVSMASSEAQGEGPEEKGITELYHNILIGELFPSGSVYLERFAFDGGFDNQQNFDGFNYSEHIEIYPIKKAKWVFGRASFSRLVKAAYIGGNEKNSKYFKYPFSKARQDALLYKVEKKRADTPITVVSINNYKIEEMIYFDGSDIREYSQIEYEAAMKHIGDDHRRKNKYGSTLSEISRANTVLNARKIALFRIKNVDYDVLLSVYHTHGIEYASTVYVIDFIKNNEIILSKEKFNIDGPY